MSLSATLVMCVSLTCLLTLQGACVCLSLISLELLELLDAYRKIAVKLFSSGSLLSLILLSFPLHSMLCYGNYKEKL